MSGLPYIKDLLSGEGKQIQGKTGIWNDDKKIFFFRITNERLDDFDESSKHLFLVSFEKH